MHGHNHTQSPWHLVHFFPHIVKTTSAPIGSSCFDKPLTILLCQSCPVATSSSSWGVQLPAADPGLSLPVWWLGWMVVLPYQYGSMGWWLDCCLALDWHWSIWLTLCGYFLWALCAYSWVIWEHLTVNSKLRWPFWNAFSSQLFFAHLVEELVVSTISFG